jgi:hypothetical protein
MSNVARALAAGVLLLVLTTQPARAAAPSFQIDQLYSNADGSVQYVILRETAGQNGQNGFKGLMLTATQGAWTSTFTFPTDLPSATTARRLVLIATAGYVALAATQPEFAAVPPDYVVPNLFLPTAGGTVVFAGADTFPYDALPGDGNEALYRTGEIKDNAVQDFNGQTVRLPLLRVNLIEYYNAVLDHYFITDLAADIDALDTGRIAGWARTGQTFPVWPANNGFLDSVCRFYIPPEHGNSHFFSAIAAECAAVLMHVQSDPNYSGYIEESTEAFFVSAPFPDGTCAYRWTPVFRLWNQRADSNHRYTTDPAIKAQMIARGYVAEGIGPDGVAMCAPTY